MKLCPKLWTQKFSHCASFVTRCCQLSLTKQEAQRDKLDRRRSSKLTIPATIDQFFIAPIVHLCLKRDFVTRAHP